jgi:hypothetical protein
VTEASSCGWEALSGDPLPWLLDEHRPASLPLPSRFCAAVDLSCQWVTLRAVVAMNAYAVAARLPRRFPQPPIR